MPHRCIKCHTIYREGTAEILNGCPKCGNNKFEYIKEEKDEPSIDKIIEETQAREEKRKITPESVESVRIVTPGEYELNLDSLLKKEEIILGIRDGERYIVPLTTVFKTHSKKKDKKEKKKETKESH
ncbi:Zn-ribbon containing protein [Candidatus Methanoperedenaceae archaeon GB37]|nr:Zn-ribbon containing protein [Candidatus Methanoperedenaceae archaeon GB37]